MWIGLLWILGCYGVSIALLHICFSTRLKQGNKDAKVLVITKNNENEIEWYIRSMFFFSRLRGRNLTAVIVDQGSTDDTIPIIERLSHTMHLQIAPFGQSMEELMTTYEHEPVIWANLSNKEEIAKIPLFD